MVFKDFCELAALSFSDAVDQAQFEVREARYVQIVKGYKAEEVARFPQCWPVSRYRWKRA